MTREEQREAGHEVIAGFGVEHTATEWANLLDMKLSLFLYCTKTEGMTVEKLYELRGFKYQPPKQRKPRESQAMLKTKERMRILLIISGYGDNDTLDSIEVKRVGNNGLHAVSCMGKPLGAYKYRSGRLTLSGGQGIPLWDMEWEDARICQNSAGLWEPHPETKTLLVKRKLSKPAEINQSEYDYLIQKHTPAEGGGRQTYEGFGKRLTAAAWARVLQVPRNTLGRHLKRGETIEEFAASRGIRKI